MKHWHHAAARYNSMVTAIMTQPSMQGILRGLHTVTGDNIRHSIQRRERVKNEQTQRMLIVDQSDAPVGTRLQAPVGT